MPYVICADCELSTYSTALWAGTDECPRCGASLPRARRSSWLSVAERDDLMRRLLDDAANGEHA